MFEFAISQQQAHKPSARFVASSIASCFLHVALLLTLIEYPHLLDTGISRWFRSQLSTYPVEDKQWRPVAVVSSPERMTMPSPETLRRLAYDWSKEKVESKQPPIRLRWSAQELSAVLDKNEATPPARPVPGTEEPQPAPPAAAPPAAAGANAAKEIAAAVIPPRPDPAAAPRVIPDRIAEAEKTAETGPKPSPEKRPSQAQVFSDQQAVIRSKESGLFDTRGFPLGDYASMVIERVKSNWFIPSNLRNSQGRTTVVFYIGRDGRFMDARIVVPSGSASLDLAALSAVVGSNPFPPLPEGFPAGRVGAKFVFSYNERQ